MSFDRAEGVLLGVCIGDSAGAILEIPIREKVDQETVEWALTLPGGGAHRIGPGQITDESEMALSLAHALVDAQPPAFPSDEVATFYGQWLNSRPFTVGKGCRIPCAAAAKALTSSTEQSPSKCMTAAATKANSTLQTNGALMRVAPLAIWGHTMVDAELARCAEQDAALTHPHENCKAASAIFCIAVAHLVHTPGDPDSAISAAIESAKLNAPPDVCHWLHEAVELGSCPSVTQAGSSEWVRWPFTYAFRHLRMRSSFETALRDILGRGGSTAANAAVVGAMMGALHGSAALPESLKTLVLERGPLSRGHPKYPRPPWLHTRLVPTLTQHLLHAAVGASVMELATPDKMSSR